MYLSVYMFIYFCKYLIISHLFCYPFAGLCLLMRVLPCVVPLSYCVFVCIYR